MHERTLRKRTLPLLMSAAAFSLTIGTLGYTSVAAQAPAAAAQAPAAGRGAQQAAVIDLTGTWVSVVTEDWRWRMVTPPKGDVSSLPINAEGRRVADTWDPAKDTAEGNACRSYGAAALMRVPGRLRFSWQDENTLKMEADAGTQTRLFRFGDVQPPAGTGDAGWQGFSTAIFEPAGARGFGIPAGGGGGRGGAAPAAPAAGAPAAGAPPAGAPPAAGAGGCRGGGRGAAPAGGGRGPGGGSMRVDTSRLKAGYLRKNGVPYSDRATMIEFFDRMTEPNGDVWFVVTTIVRDPVYINGDFITSTHFKREPNDSKFSPKPCVAS